MKHERQRFLGTYDTKPLGYSGNERMFQEDFGFLRKDGKLVISVSGTDTDGASIPRFFWRIIGSPLHGVNKYFAAGHDSLYNATAVIIDTYKYPGTAEAIFYKWRVLMPHGFIHRADLTRKWADQHMLEVMEFMRVPWWKRKLVYRAVRMFGGKAYQ